MRFAGPFTPVVQTRISTVLRQQFGGCALFHNAAALHHDHPVGVFDGGQTVCHDQGGAPLHGLF